MTIPVFFYFLTKVGIKKYKKFLVNFSKKI